MTINEFPSGPSELPRYIKAGPDGNLYYAAAGSAGGIVQMNTRGEVAARFGQPNGPVDLAFAPSGTLFWAGDNAIGERRSDGAIEEGKATAGYASFVAPSGEWRWTQKSSVEGQPTEQWCAAAGLKAGGSFCHETFGAGRITGLAVDSAGNWWGAYYEDNTLHELTEPEHVLELPENSGPVRLVLGPDNALWVTMYKADAVDRLAADGSRRRFPLPAGAGPNDITVGPEGALWVTEYKANKIARLTMAGTVSEYPIPTVQSNPIGIARGSDGALWFTESKAGKIGRLVPDPLPAGGPGGGESASGGQSTSVPSFTRSPAFQPVRFRSPASKHSRTVHKGSVLTFTLTEAAKLQVQVARVSPGRRMSGKCIAPSHANRHKPRCTRYISIGRFSASALAGASSVPFSGRVGGHALAPGSYRATIVATDAAGNGSAPATAAFTIAP